jgi:hypothetical protein
MGSMCSRNIRDHCFAFVQDTSYTDPTPKEPHSSPYKLHEDDRLNKGSLDYVTPIDGKQ